MGNDFQAFFKNGDARVVRVADQFQGSMSKVDEETRKTMVSKRGTLLSAVTSHGVHHAIVVRRMTPSSSPLWNH